MQHRVRRSTLSKLGKKQMHPLKQPNAKSTRSSHANALVLTQQPAPKVRRAPSELVLKVGLREVVACLVVPIELAPLAVGPQRRPGATARDRRSNRQAARGDHQCCSACSSCHLVLSRPTIGAIAATKNSVPPGEAAHCEERGEMSQSVGLSTPIDTNGKSSGFAGLTEILRLFPRAGMAN